MLHPVEQKNVLDSMSILVDTREQPTARAKRRYEAFKRPYRRATLSYGDYTYNFVLGGSERFQSEETVEGLCIVERKMNLDELAMCFTRERDRFQREFERAAAAGASIWLIVENATWENLLNGKYKSRLNPKAFEASLMAWIVRYNIHLVFCKEDTTGELIQEIMYRDLKERLEDGRLG